LDDGYGIGRERVGGGGRMESFPACGPAAARSVTTRQPAPPPGLWALRARAQVVCVAALSRWPARGRVRKRREREEMSADAHPHAHHLSHAHTLPILHSNTHKHTPQGPTALLNGLASRTWTTRTARNGTPRIPSSSCPTCGARAGARPCRTSSSRAVGVERTRSRRRPRRREREGGKEEEDGAGDVRTRHP
jgi:hypothetical protein